MGWCSGYSFVSGDCEGVIMSICMHCGGELNTAYICIKCGKDNQPAPRGGETTAAPITPEGVDLLERMRDYKSSLKPFGDLIGIPVMVDECMPAGSWRLIVAPDVMEQIREQTEQT